MKVRRVWVSLLVFLMMAFSEVHIDVSPETILSKLKDFIAYQPQEKVYLHLDKPVYAAGEDIWFSTYLLNASTHQLDSLSRVVYVELFNASKVLALKRFLYTPQGTARGDFHLPDTLPEGTYLIRAYTHHMKNQDEDFFFTKRIPVLSASKFHKPVEKTQPSDIQFFPEGGNLIAGIENRVAFKAINQKGSGISVEGSVKDHAGNVVASFESQHKGMGMFRLTPVAGEKYEAVVKSMNGAYPLPSMDNEGYLLRVMDMGPTFKIIVAKNFNASSPTVFLVAQTRGEVNFTAKAEMKGQSLVLNIPKSRFVSGISQITLFDSSGIPQCERLVFVNHPGVNISALPDKPLYKPREKVNLDISVTGPDGAPVAGSFSLSIYDSINIKDPEPYHSTIVDYLLLTSDLTGYVDEPGYYLKDTLVTTKQHLDLLMMTHGWRRFTWKEVTAEQTPDELYKHEVGIPISGNVMRGKKPAKKNKIKLLTTEGDFMDLNTDSLGRFYSDGMVFFDTVQVAIQTDNKNGTPSSFTVNFNPPNQGSPLKMFPAPIPYFEAAEFLGQIAARNRVSRGYAPGEDAILLKSIEVKGQRLEDDKSQDKFFKPFKPYGTADATVEARDFKGGYANILQALVGKVPGLIINGSGVTIRASRSFNVAGAGSSEPLFLLNGFQVDLSMIMNIPINDVESVDVLKNVENTAVYGSRGANGVIAVYTRPGMIIPQGPMASLRRIKYPGFYRARKFYVPKYDQPQGDNITDIRNTLYWNPSVKTNSKGKARVSFFASDVLTNYRIQIEGISANGYPGFGSGSMVVK